MLKLNPNYNLNNFFASLRTSKKAVLFLDYDGTLAPFHIDPTKAMPYPGIIELIQQIIEETKTRVILISGRAINNLTPLINELNPLPEIWGSHGGERLKEDKSYFRQELTSDQVEGLEQGWKLAIKHLPPERCEKKPTTVATHWRGISENEAEKIKKEIANAWQPLLTSSQLEIHQFDRGIELRVVGINKGTAVKTVLSELPAQIPIAYLGDDATDEEAFEFIGNKGLKVLVRQEHRKTLADIQIIPPDELFDFLKTWKETTALNNITTMERMQNGTK